MNNYMKNHTAYLLAVVMFCGLSDVYAAGPKRGNAEAGSYAPKNVQLEWAKRFGLLNRSDLTVNSRAIGHPRIGYKNPSDPFAENREAGKLWPKKAQGRARPSDLPMHDSVLYPSGASRIQVPRRRGGSDFSARGMRPATPVITQEEWLGPRATGRGAGGSWNPRFGG